MTAHVVFADPPLPSPTTRGDEGPVWTVGTGYVWLRASGRIECSPGRTPWTDAVAERFQMAIAAARAAAGVEWRDL